MTLFAFEYQITANPGTRFRPDMFDALIGSEHPFHPHGRARLQATAVTPDGRTATLRFTCPDDSPVARYVRADPRDIKIRGGGGGQVFEFVARPVPTCVVMVQDSLWLSAHFRAGTAMCTVLAVLRQRGWQG